MMKALRLATAVVALLSAIGLAGAGANVANDRLLALSPKDQALFLGAVMQNHCAGSAAFYMGSGKSGLAKDKAFWSVRCSDGREFEIQIAPDAKGSTSGLPCSSLKALTGVECFRKFAK